MQKLVWQNANGEIIDLTSGSYGITEWEGFSNASLNIQSQQVPFQDGAVFLDALIEPRELSVTLAIQDNNDLELRYQLRRELIHKLNPKLGEGYLIYTNDFISKRIKCVAQIPLFETHNSNDSGTPKASLSWTASEPYWEDLEETVVEISGLNTIQNEGDVPAQVEIIIPIGASNPSIINHRNKKIIKLTGDYVNSIDINTNLGQKYIKENILDISWLNGGALNCICYGCGKYIYGGTLLLIEDNINGSIHFVNNGRLFIDIIFENNKFMAIDGNRNVLTSPNGINWTSKYIGDGLTSTFTAIAYGNGLYIITTYADGKILTSTDGINWNSIDISETHLMDIIFENNMFVIVGYNGKILTSPDGINWTSRTSGVSIELYSITYGNGLFVAVGANGTILTSPDGINWTTRMSTSYTNTLYSVTYGNGLYVAVGYNSFYENGIIFTSTDGINWTSQTSGVNNRLDFVYYQNNLYKICGYGGTILTSTNGIDWIINANGISNYFRGIAFGNNLFVTITDVSRGKVFTSIDCISWTERSISGIINPLNDIIFENNMFVIVGYNGKILTSPDGINWTSRTSGVSVRLDGVAFGNNLFVVVGASGTILTSIDGINWLSRTSGVSVDLTNIIYANNQFIVVGKSGTILTSPDGINWTSRTSGLSADLISVAFGNNIYIITALNHTLLSYDSVNWFESSVYLGGKKIIFANNLFITTGLKISPDGINWTSKYSEFGLIITDIIYENDNFVMVGNNGVVMKSILQSLNLISDLTPDSDMTFNLEIGSNNILYSDDNGNGATLKFRQKYIGV